MCSVVSLLSFCLSVHSQWGAQVTTHGTVHLETPFPPPTSPGPLPHSKLRLRTVKIYLIIDVNYYIESSKKPSESDVAFAFDVT